MKNILNSSKPMKLWLNVASSTYVLKDFINLDNHVFLKYRALLPFIKGMLTEKHAKLANEYSSAMQRATLLQHDCRKKLNFGDNTVDHILCSHFLEHVYLDEANTILADFFRVLKPKGTLHIIVPDLNLFVSKYLEMRTTGNDYAGDEFMNNCLLSKPSKGSLRYRLMEFYGGFGLQHRWMYDSASMSRHILNAGFTVDNTLDVPSDAFRKNDDSVHIRAFK